MKRETHSLGGKAIKKKKPPDVCPRCGKPMKNRVWHSFLGHLGLHGLADNYFGGDIEAAQFHLRRNGQARTDSAPYNGAFPRYQELPLKDVDKQFPKKKGEKCKQQHTKNSPPKP